MLGTFGGTAVTERWRVRLGTVSLERPEVSPCDLTDCGHCPAPSVRVWKGRGRPTQGFSWHGGRPLRGMLSRVGSVAGPHPQTRWWERAGWWGRRHGEPTEGMGGESLG